MSVRVSGVERSLSHTFNPLLYTVHVSHGDFHWTVRRRYHHFRDLHVALRMYRATEALRAGPRWMAAQSTIRRPSAGAAELENAKTVQDPIFFF